MNEIVKKLFDEIVKKGKIDDKELFDEIVKINTCKHEGVLELVKVEPADPDLAGVDLYWAKCIKCGEMLPPFSEEEWFNLEDANEEMNP